MRHQAAEPPPHDFCSPLSVPLERSCWLRIRGCGTGEFQEQGQCFFIALSCSIPTIVFYTIFPFLFFLSIGWYCGAGVFGLIECISLSLSLALPTFFNNNNNNNNNIWKEILHQLFIIDDINGKELDIYDFYRSYLELTKLLHNYKLRVINFWWHLIVNN